MAKKSARSKGYRKFHQETKGYTPQEKKIMTIGFIVIAVVLIAVLVLPDFIESFSLLKVKDGVVQDMGDNWLICNTGTSSKDKYRKMGEVTGEIEGFELSETAPGITDENCVYYVYKPTSEDAHIQTLNIQPGNGEASELSETFRTQMANFGEVMYMSDAVEEEEINGMKTYAVALQYRSENYEEAIAEAEAEADAEAAGEEVAETEETEETEEEVVYDYTQSVVLYIDTNVDGKCILLNAMNTGDSEDVFQDVDAILDVLRQAATAITLE